MNECFYAAMKLTNSYSVLAHNHYRALILHLFQSIFKLFARNHLKIRMKLMYL